MENAREKLKEWEKLGLLEEVVLTKSPAETKQVYKELGEVAFTAQALGLACRFRGLEMVKTLVECGARFDFTEDDSVRSFFKLTSRPAVGENYALGLLSTPVIYYVRRLDMMTEPFGLSPLPFAERLAILDYFIKDGGNFGFDGGGLMYFAYFAGELEMAEALKKSGARLPEKHIKLMTEGGESLEWITYCWYSGSSGEKYAECMAKLLDEAEAETGARPKLHFTDNFWQRNKEIFSKPENFRFLLENSKQEKMKKTDMMKEFIKSGNVPCLELAAEQGWLKQPKKRDEMISYANEKGKTECTAWLLDFKNRTADLKAERERAEKKQQRELNAAPDSLIAMRKLWKWEKSEKDGTIVITGYKGDRTEVVVPEKIGGDTVTAIGEYAFSPFAKRIPGELRRSREKITKITLPDTITEIGECAFHHCRSLCEINIPAKVAEIPRGAFTYAGFSDIVIEGNIKKIGSLAFFDCERLKTAVLCEGVEEIDEAAFFHCEALESVEIPRSVRSINLNQFNHSFTACRRLTVKLYKGSYAEKFCKKNKIPFVYKE